MKKTITIDYKAERTYVTCVNKMIKAFNNVNADSIITRVNFSQIITPNGKLPLTLTLRTNGLLARVANVALFWDLTTEKWHEVRVAGLSEEAMDNLDPCQKDFTDAVSKAAFQLMKQYGLMTMNCEKRMTTIINETMEHARLAMWHINARMAKYPHATITTLTRIA